ncbi:Methionyl-tRNA formyltransferase [[Clostridium] ultunense Esp]|nr:Methionyl-tRNA formyltransferase [[Clostridium] ultunense Esp]
MRILFLGDGKWATLSLLKILDSNEFEVIGVVLRYNNPDIKLKLLAEKNNISVYMYKNINDKRFIEIMKEKKIDLGVSMSFDQIIKEDLRQVARFGFINCHAGKLPNYRGRNIINWAIINDEKEIGITVHFIDNGIDTGDIIAQKAISITEEDNYGTLLEKVTYKCPEILYESIIKIKNGNFERIKQDHINGSYFSYRRMGDELIDWNWSSRRIYNFIRALYEPSPGAQTYYKGEKIHVWESQEIDYPIYISTPGEIIGKNNNGIIVKTGDSAIMINKVSDNIISEKYVPNFKIGERLGINLYNKIIELQEEINDIKKSI